MELYTAKLYLISLSKDFTRIEEFCRKNKFKLRVGIKNLYKKWTKRMKIFRFKSVTESNNTIKIEFKCDVTFDNSRVDDEYVIEMIFYIDTYDIIKNVFYNRRVKILDINILNYNTGEIRQRSFGPGLNKATL